MAGPHQRALDLVTAERARQDDAHGTQTCASHALNDLEKLSILVEEVGELAQAMNDHRWPTTDSAIYPERAKRIRDELVHVAAVSVAWIESFLI